MDLTILPRCYLKETGHRDTLGSHVCLDVLLGGWAADVTFHSVLSWFWGCGSWVERKFAAQRETVAQCWHVWPLTAWPKRSNSLITDQTLPCPPLHHKGDFASYQLCSQLKVKNKDGVYTWLFSKSSEARSHHLLYKQPSMSWRKLRVISTDQTSKHNIPIP